MNPRNEWVIKVYKKSGECCYYVDHWENPDNTINFFTPRFNFNFIPDEAMRFWTYKGAVPIVDLIHRKNGHEIESIEILKLFKHKKDGPTGGMLALKMNFVNQK